MLPNTFRVIMINDFASGRAMITYMAVAVGGSIGLSR